MQKIAPFQSNRAQAEQEILVQLLSEIEKNPSVTQRNLAAELGIALGLMNGYLKRCATKGWIRIKHVSPRRITYFLTPEGLKEKSRMVTDYVGRSLTFFRTAKEQCESLLLACHQRGWNNIALIGESDLIDIAKLVALRLGVNVFVEQLDADLSQYDAVLITDINSHQDTYNILSQKITFEKILILDLLQISKNDNVAGISK